MGKTKVFIKAPESVSNSLVDFEKIFLRRRVLDMRWFLTCTIEVKGTRESWENCSKQLQSTLSKGLQRQFLAQHSVATLLRHCFERSQHCSTIATLCCAKNRRCELSRVTWRKKDALGTGTIHVSYGEANKGSKERQRQTPGVRLMEVSVKTKLTVWHNKYPYPSCVNSRLWPKKHLCAYLASTLFGKGGEKKQLISRWCLNTSDLLCR